MRFESGKGSEEPRGICNMVGVFMLLKMYSLGLGLLCQTPQWSSIHSGFPIGLGQWVSLLPSLIRLVCFNGHLQVVLALFQIQQGQIISARRCQHGSFAQSARTESLLGNFASHHPSAELSFTQLFLFALNWPRAQGHTSLIELPRY
jgi:hypothetical protein